MKINPVTWLWGVFRDTAKGVISIAQTMLPQRELWAVVRPGPGGSYVEQSVHRSFDEAAFTLQALLPTRPDATVMKHAEMQIANRKAAMQVYGRRTEEEQ